METFDKIKNIIISEMGFISNDINLNSGIINDLQLDSLDFIELTVLIEREFNILIDDETSSKIFTISDLCFSIDLKLKNK